MKAKLLSLSLLIFIICTSTGCHIIKRFEGNFFGEKTNLLSYEKDADPIHFQWGKSTFGTYVERQAAIMVEVDFMDMQHKLYMQFDTGSPHTYLYEKDLESLEKMGLDFQVISVGDKEYVEKIEFNLGGSNFSASMIRIMKDYGHEFTKSDTLKRFSVGSIGSDFLEGKVTTIDYIEQEITIYNERPTELPDSIFFPFDFMGRRMMLPSENRGKKYELFFDTGCSAYGLITTKNRFKRYAAKGEKVIKYDANSWGNKMPIASAPSHEVFRFGNQDISISRVSYYAKYTMFQPLVLPFTRIGGWLGNQPFTNSVLIIDTISEEFAVIQK